MNPVLSFAINGGRERGIRLLMARGASRADAEDIVQDVTLRIFTLQPENIDNVQAYFLMALVNEQRNHGRKGTHKGQKLRMIPLSELASRDKERTFADVIEGGDAEREAMDNMTLREVGAIATPAQAAALSEYLAGKPTNGRIRAAILHLRRRLRRELDAR